MQRSEPYGGVGLEWPTPCCWEYKWEEEEYVFMYKTNNFEQILLPKSGKTQEPTCDALSKIRITR